MYAKLRNAVLRVSQAFMVACIFCMVIVVLAGVVFRYILHAPLAWAEEAALLCQVWMACIGASVLYECYGHMGIDMFVERVPHKFRSIIENFSEILLLALFVFLTAAGIEVSWTVKESITPGLGVSVALQYLPVACGGMLMVFWSIERIYGKAKICAKGERMPS
jgi:TRAP-type C4-dicarboxylate transport system permease small subunit